MVLDVQLGQLHTCALLNDGNVRCWGSGQFGVLGTGNTIDVGKQPGQMEALQNLPLGSRCIHLSAGLRHTCALLESGNVKCWGRANLGPLGNGITDHVGDSPGEVASASNLLDFGAPAVAVTTGEYHSCVLLDTSDVKCWGRNNVGQLGRGSTTTLNPVPAEMAAIANVHLGAGRTAVAVSAKGSHTCALLDTGGVKCWGGNTYGQLGYDSTDNKGDAIGEMEALPTVDLGSGNTAVALSAGGWHTCAVLNDGSLKCWGRNNYGQLGLGVNDAHFGSSSGHMASLQTVFLGAGATAVDVSAGSRQFEFWSGTSASSVVVCHPSASAGVCG